MTAAPQSEKFKLVSAGLGVVTVLVGVMALIYNDKLAGAGIVTSGLAVTTHALS